MSVLKEQDIILLESWIGIGMLDMLGGEVVMVELLGCNLQFIVVFVYNDNMVVGVLIVLKDNGIVILLYFLIIGFDDIFIVCYIDL